MTALFLQAAASYFGLGDVKPRRSELFTDGGEIVAVFELVLSPDDVAGIADRMKALQTAQAAPGEVIVIESEPIYREAMRKAYDALSPAEKSRFGSFARYLAMGGVTSDAADFGGMPG